MSEFINSILDGTLKKQKKVKKKRVREKDEKLVGNMFKVFDRFQEKGYENREGQLDMALDIAEAIKDHDHLIVEGGVGIGKSFAYLIPSLYTYKFNRKPIIIATSTIQLSEQLVEDIVQAKHITGIYQPKVVLAKGKNNYACKIKADKIENIDKELYEWVIKEGDQASLNLNVNESTWEKIQVDDSCNYDHCSFSKKCDYLNMRKNINSKGKANIIIVNQDLLIAHLVKKNTQGYTILNDNSQIIIVDEAHNLEDKTRNILKEEWSQIKIQKTIERAYKKVNIKDDDILKKSDFLNNEISNFYDDLYKYICNLKENDDKLKEANRFPISNNYDLAIIKKIRNYIRDISITFQLYNSLSDFEQDKIIEELSLLEKLFDNLISKEEYNDLIWLELNHNNVIISSAPKDINKELKKLLFNEDKSIILTSATLTQSGSYNYLIEKLGFPNKDIFISPPKKSPFPYEDNVLNYIPDSIANPNEKEEYIKDISDEIMKLTNLTEGRTLALFTSKENLNLAFELLKNKPTNYKVLKQSNNSSQSEIIDEFISSKGLLLATGTFWEGVDISGDDLSSLIITKLPFPVPDPIIEYKTSQVKNKFDVLVPEMIVKLKQGMGRLIRSNNDKGIISILDSRVNSDSSSPYRKDVIDSLLSTNVTNSFKKVKLFVKDNFDYI